jgi:hypothetical protein
MKKSPDNHFCLYSLCEIRDMPRPITFRRFGKEAIFRLQDGDLLSVAVTGGAFQPRGFFYLAESLAKDWFVIDIDQVEPSEKGDPPEFLKNNEKS